jgi:DEAD/DEAH box helicase domain-containing protein
MKQIRTNFQQSSKSDLLRRVMSYRGGYTPQDRRRIEKQMFSGELLAVIATNALELGVDIGSLGKASEHNIFLITSS